MYLIVCINVFARTHLKGYKHDRLQHISAPHYEEMPMR